LRAAGGRPLVALIGKLLPLFGLFVIMEVIVAVILHALYDVSFRGDPLMVAAAAILHILGYLGFGRCSFC
jgi:ABC-2 type transport system permease protein